MTALSVIGVLLYLGSAQAQNIDVIVKCPGAKGPQPADPPLPFFPDDEFQVRIEGNFVNKYISFQATEYYSKAKNKGTLVMFQDGAQYTLVFDYNTNEVLAATDNGDCRVTPISKNPFNDLFGKGGKIMTVEQMFRFGSAYNQTYKGMETVRGIPCYRWQSCLQWPDIGATFTADWYWTVSNWTSPGGLQAPVRLEVSGSATSGGNHSFHHIYDFFDFRDYVVDTDRNVFETPDLTACPGRKNSKPLPQLSPQYSYREEIILPTYDVVLYTDVWYDSKNKLLRMDTLSPSAYSRNPVSEIHDYNTGVKYLIDKIQLNCTLSQLTNDTFDSSSNFTNFNGYHLRMKNPMEMFLINNRDHFAYNGQKMYRGVHVDRWVGVTDTMKLLFEDPFNSTVEIYFLAADSSTVPNSQTGDGSVEPVLVGLEVASDQVAYYAQYHVYNWNSEAIGNAPFNIAPCYQQEDTKRFHLRFPLKYDPKYGTQLQYIIQETSFAVSVYTGVSTLRLQDSRIHHTPTDLYLSTTLLPPVPYLAQFTNIQGKFLLRQDDKQIFDIETPEECADECVNWFNFTCNSFDFCTDVGACLLSTDHVSKGETDKDYKCSHYSRTVNGGTPEVPLDDAFMQLQLAVKDGDFQIMVPMDDGLFLTLKATEIKESNYSSSGGKKCPDVNPGKSTILPSGPTGTVTPGGHTVPPLGPTVTANHGGSTRPPLGPNDTVNPGGRTVPPLRPTGTGNHGGSTGPPSGPTGTGKWRDQFQLYRYKAQIMDAPMTLTQTTVEDCAGTCLQEYGPECGSFDYCASTGVCHMRTNILVDSQANLTYDASCDVYARKFTSRFRQWHGKTISSGGDKSVTSVASVEECAQDCVANSAWNCKSFQYCPTSQNCALSKKHQLEIPINSSWTLPECYHYSRSYIDDFKQVGSFQVPHTSDMEVIIHVDVGECAKACVDNTGANCQSFLYCDAAKSCILSPPSSGPSTGKAAVNKTTENCRKFKRVFYDDGTPVVATPKPQTDDDTKYSKGAMAGLAIGMIVVGALLCLAAVLIHGRLRGRRNTDHYINESFGLK